jgi:hypothetical protein
VCAVHIVLLLYLDRVAAVWLLLMTGTEIDCYGLCRAAVKCGLYGNVIIATVNVLSYENHFVFCCTCEYRVFLCKV